MWGILDVIQEGTLTLADNAFRVVKVPVIVQDPAFPHDLVVVFQGDDGLHLVQPVVERVAARQVEGKASGLVQFHRAFWLRDGKPFVHQPWRIKELSVRVCVEHLKPPSIRLKFDGAVPLGGDGRRLVGDQHDGWVCPGSVGEDRRVSKIWGHELDRHAGSGT